MKNLNRFWFFFCLFIIASFQMVAASDGCKLASTNGTEIEKHPKYLGVDNAFIRGTRSFEQGNYISAAAFFRQSLEARNHASGHIALGKALLRTAETSNNPQTKSIFREAISQFEFYPLAVKPFQESSAAYLTYLRSHHNKNEANRFEKRYKQRLHLLENDASRLHSSKPVNLEKYKKMPSIISLQ